MRREGAATLSRAARRALLVTSAAIGGVGLLLRPWPLCLLALALSLASLLNYALYTGAFTWISALDMGLAAIAGATYMCCAIATQCWVGLCAALATIAAYAGRRHPDHQVGVHALALLALGLYMVE